MTAKEKLDKRTSRGLHICVGLDTDINKIPKHLLSSDDPVYQFNKGIIEATSGAAAAYKINFAFYESEGEKGMEALKRTIGLIPEDVLTIGDAKRGDIGNTSEMYAKSVFDHFGFDAITLSPYMGVDSLKPFLDYKEKLSFVLALTSNPGACDFEKLALQGGDYLFQRVISVFAQSDKTGNCGFVFGATKLDELKDNVKIFNGAPVLLPGVGAQGGSLEEVVKVFESAGHNSYIINVSRALIYADSTGQFAPVVKKTLENYNKIITEIKESV